MRNLTRSISHRKALLRNLATSVLLKESITTTFAKAKEAQRYTEQIITIAKRNTSNAKQRAADRLFEPGNVLPKLFGELRSRYHGRKGGYTRLLQVPARRGDNAPQAILELVNGTREMRLAVTARAIALETVKAEADNVSDGTANITIKEPIRLQPQSDITRQNLRKVCLFRPNAKAFVAEQVKQHLKTLHKEKSVTNSAPDILERLESAKRRERPSRTKQQRFVQR